MNFAVPVKMVFVNDNDNRCISGLFCWDFGLVLSIVRNTRGPMVL